ncbi:MAG: glycosyltransferase [Candidatus Zixiibacteriota bacterium]
MRILVFADGLSWHTERYIRELRAQGCSVTAASFDASQTIDVCLKRSVFGEFASYALLAPQIQALIEAEKPDVVNSHFASAYGFAAARCRNRSGGGDALRALTVWGSDILVSPRRSPLHRLRVRYALNGADIIIADSTHLKEATGAYTDRPVSVIPWGIERRLVISDDELQRKSHWPEKGPLRVIAPRPHRKVYRNEIILKALTPALRSGQARLTVSSQGAGAEAFRARVTDARLNESVTFYDSLQRDDFIRLLGEHHVCASAAESDSSPVSMIEALALGVAPVMADHPGLYDFINPRQSAFSLFDPDTPETFLTAVESLAALSRSAREDILRINRDRALEQGVYEENLGRTIGLFEERLSRRRN